MARGREGEGGEGHCVLTALPYRLSPSQGSHIYEFGDHGAIIVMANDMHETSSISYSWNEGASWHSFQFTREEPCCGES